MGGLVIVAEVVAELLVVEVLFVGFGVSGNMVRALERMAAGNMSNFAPNSVAQWVFAPGCDNCGDKLSTGDLGRFGPDASILSGFRHPRKTPPGNGTGGRSMFGRVLRANGL